MKFKSLFAAAIAAVAVLVGCQGKEEPVEEAKLSVSPQTLSFEAAAGEKTVQLTSTREWKAQIKYEGDVKDWLSVSPESGSACPNGQNVTITAKANEGKDRKATVTFTIGLFKSSLEVSQVGKDGPDPVNDGSKEHPFTVAEAIQKCEEAGETPTTDVYYVKGFVSVIKEITDASSFGNATFTIADTKNVEESTPVFTCYRVKYFNGVMFPSTDVLEEKDEVVVKAQLVNYKGSQGYTPETQNGEMYSINGKTAEDEPQPEPITGDNLLTNGGFETWTAAKPEAWDFTNGNASLTKVDGAKEGSNACEIAGDPTGENNLRLMSKEYKLKPGTYQIQTYVKGAGQYRLGYAKLTNHKVADTSKDYVYIDANPVQATSDWTLHYVQFKLEQETSVSVIVMNSKVGGGKSVMVDDVKLVTKDGGLGTEDPEPVPGTPSGTGTENDPFNATAAINAAVAAGSEAPSTEFYYIKGFVSGDPSIDTGQYGNATFYITDTKGGNTIPFYCFQVMYIGGAKFTSTDQLKKGDEVVVYAQVVNYKGNTPETNGKGTGKIVSINGGSEAADYFSVSPLSISASASSTTASFNVSANVPWTVTCDNAAFTLGQTSGEGSATVSVTFEQNTGIEDKVANITVSTMADVATKSYTVVLTQKAPSTGNGYVKISSVDDVTDGTYVIVGSSNGKFYAMSNKNESTYATSYLNPHEISVSSDVISASDGDAYAVTITKKGSNYVIQGEKFISYSGSETYFAFSDTEPSDAWTLTLGDYGFVFAATNDSTRGLVYRFGNTHRFASYKLTNVKGTEYTGVQLYKLQN